MTPSFYLNQIAYDTQNVVIVLFVHNHKNDVSMLCKLTYRHNLK